MANKEACQVYIEQEIQEGLAKGKTPYSIGKDLSSWVEKLFETSIPVKTLQSRAWREKTKLTSNEVNHPTNYNNSENLQKQEYQEVTVASDRAGPGRSIKYAPERERYSCAQQMADLAISHLGRIPQDDPKRQEAFSQVIAWIQQSLKKEMVNVI